MAINGEGIFRRIINAPANLAKSLVKGHVDIIKKGVESSVKGVTEAVKADIAWKQRAQEKRIQKYAERRGLDLEQAKKEVELSDKIAGSVMGSTGELKTLAAQAPKAAKLVRGLTEEAPGIIKTGEKLLGEAKAIVPKIKVGNIRLDKFHLPEGGTEDIARIIQENSGFIGQRRGVQTVQKTVELAKEIQPSIKLKKGTALNAEELHALGDTVGSLQVRVSGLAKKVAEGVNTDIDILRLQEAKTELATALASYSGATAEAGRSLQILRASREAIRSGDPDLIKKALELSGGRANVEDIAKKLVDFGDDDIGKYRFLRDLQKPNAADYFDWYYYNNLLSGPLTHIKNTFANAMNLGADIASKPFAAFIDFTKTKGARAIGKTREREVFLGEMPSELLGAYQGMKAGANKALFMLKNGYSLEKVAKSEFAKPEVFKGIAPNIISRGLQASDEFFRSMFSSKELYSQAFTIAKKEGLSGTKLAERAAQLVSDPTPQMIERSARAGAKGVYQEEAGPFIKALGKLRDASDIKIGANKYRIFNPAKFVIPFLQTPANVIKEGFQMTPIGFLSAAGEADPRMASKIQGRALMGTAVLAPLAFAASEGRISGNGPSDKNLLDALKATGWQPNSIKIGRTWHSYQATPLAVPLALMGNAAEMFTYEGEKPSVGALIAKMGNTLLDQSFLTGLSSLQQALADPDRYAKSFVNNTLRSLVPASSLLGQTARATDRTVRLTDTVGENIQAGIPGLSQNLPAQRTALGEEVQRPGSLLNQFNPVKASKEEENIVYHELKDLGIDTLPSKPSRTVDGSRLKAKLYSELMRVSGGLKNKMLIEIFDTEEYQVMPTDKKIKLVEKVYSKANDIGRQYIRGESELDRLRISHGKLDANQREILNDIITSKEYKAHSDVEKLNTLKSAWNSLQD